MLREALGRAADGQAAVQAAGKKFKNEDHILNWLTKAARTEHTNAVSA